MSAHRGTRLLAALAVALAAIALAATAASAVGFLDTTLPTQRANPLSSPTAIVPLLDTGRALVLEKGGAVRILQADGTLLATDALTLSVCTDSEEGLLGAAVDPGFATNGFVYLYYTRNAGNCASSTGRFNRVSRFTMRGDTIDPASELILLDDMDIPAGNHNGGDLEFGNDGDLYVSVGDGGTNPRGSGPSAAQDLSLLNGKILRIGTTPGAVPPDNPLVGMPNATSCATTGIRASTVARCTQIYDWGLRNPFRFAFDPNTTVTRFFVNDVGQSTWEEVDQGGAGLNYGWDSREGFCDEGSSSTCPPTPAGFTDPLTTYNHTSGCTYITAGAFVPDNTWAPTATYDGAYLFGDGGCGKVFLRTAAGAVDYDVPFAQTTGVITDMTFLTQQGTTALYYVTNQSSQLHRITGPPAPPKPVVPVTPPLVPPATGATGTTPPKTTSGAAAARCRIAAVRGLLAATARATIASRHCTARQIVVAMRDGRPLVRHGRLVHARSAARPRRSPGRHRTWTLRVEKVAQKAGRTYVTGAHETIWVGWESTPAGIATQRRAHYR
jgi:glucose/arabinose dehydrogenase